MPTAPDEPTEVCPGCGAVLVPLPGSSAVQPGASPSCSRLFEVTLRGLREETGADPTAAATVQLADDAYAAQHPDPGDPAVVRAALDRLHHAFGGHRPPRDATRPGRWRTTVADVAADLDVIDLPVLVEAWARSVHGDWIEAASPASSNGTHTSHSERS